METEIKPGDRVDFLDEVGGGTVVAIGSDGVRVRDEDGFEYAYPAEKLVVRRWNGEGSDEPVVKDARPRRTDYDEEARGYRIAGGKKPYMEVDLHIHMLVESERGMDNAKILAIQLEHFRRTLETARDKGMQKIVFIHGVGRGVLREELRRKLGELPGIEYGNADFRIYGGGATEVKLYSSI